MKLTKLELEVKKIETKVLEKLTQDDFKPNRKETKLLVDLAFLESGRDELKNKEIEKMIDRVLIVIILELFERKGLVKRNKKGFYDKTKLGREVMKLLDAKRSKQE